jgi:hypothetical protein
MSSSRKVTAEDLWGSPQTKDETGITGKLLLNKLLPEGTKLKKEKTGRLRGTLLGKRGNFTGRKVLSEDDLINRAPTLCKDPSGSLPRSTQQSTKPINLDFDGWEFPPYYPADTLSKEDHKNLVSKLVGKEIKSCWINYYDGVPTQTATDVIVKAFDPVTNKVDLQMNYKTYSYSLQGVYRFEFVRSNDKNSTYIAKIAENPEMKPVQWLEITLRH